MSRVLREKYSLPSIQPDVAYFDDFYRASIIGRGKSGSYTVEETAAILWDTLQSHQLMVDFSKYEIKCHPSITYIFVCFLIEANIYEPLK